MASRTTDYESRFRLVFSNCEDAEDCGEIMDALCVTARHEAVQDLFRGETLVGANPCVRPLSKRQTNDVSGQTCGPALTVKISQNFWNFGFLVLFLHFPNMKV